jgi:hypothetical protein
MPFKPGGLASIRAIPELPKVLHGLYVTTVSIASECPENHDACRLWNVETSSRIGVFPQQYMRPIDGGFGTDEMIARIGLPPILTEEMVLATRPKAPEKAVS